MKRSLVPTLACSKHINLTFRTFRTCFLDNFFLRLRQAKKPKLPMTRPRQQTTSIKGQSSWLKLATVAPKNSMHQHSSLVSPSWRTSVYKNPIGVSHHIIPMTVAHDWLICVTFKQFHSLTSITPSPKKIES